MGSIKVKEPPRGARPARLAVEGRRDKSHRRKPLPIPGTHFLRKEHAREAVYSLRRFVYSHPQAGLQKPSWNNLSLWGLRYPLTIIVNEVSSYFVRYHYLGIFLNFISPE